jgi:small subunit ribosomal protein S20
MAKTKSAKKQARQAVHRQALNRMQLSRLRTHMKKVEAAIASGNKAEAQEAFVAAQPILMRAATKGYIHRNTVARKLSRYSARIKSFSKS